MKKEYWMILGGLLLGLVFGGMMLLLVPGPSEHTLYYNQVGLYSQQENASQAVLNLQTAGFEGYLVHRDDMYYVLANFSFEKTENTALTEKLEAAGFHVVAKEVTLPDTYDQANPEALIDYLESR